MILSFHPCFEADHNLICAGRDPGPADLAAIRAAQAVILPQGCSEKLYRMARENCLHVFPCWDVKFDYPGKIGQIKLFREHQVPHPPTHLFENLNAFHRKQAQADTAALFAFPFVLKFNWGGEGEGVFPIDSGAKLETVLDTVAAFESNGQKGFLVQEFIPCANRSLRVVVIGELLISYWRIQEKTDTVLSHISRGAIIDHERDSELQHAGRTAAGLLCQQTGINLAGFDFLFFEKDNRLLLPPLFLEINYFFGRTGLGGSEKYYALLTEQIQKWLAKLDP